jgi:hypothetical protein
MMVMMDAVRFALHGAVNIPDTGGVVNSRLGWARLAKPTIPIRRIMGRFGGADAGETSRMQPVPVLVVPIHHSHSTTQVHLSQRPGSAEVRLCPAGP